MSSNILKTGNTKQTATMIESMVQPEITKLAVFSLNIFPCSAFEVTTLWCYKNLFIIISAKVFARDYVITGTGLSVRLFVTTITK